MENKFDFICETVDNGIILLNKDLKVLFWNNWLETRTNITSPQILGSALTDFYPNINTKTLKRKINTSLKLDISTFYNTKTNGFLLDIELNKVTNKIFENMQQAVTITPFNIQDEIVILYIYDNTQLSEVNYQLNLAKESLQNTHDEIKLLLDTAMEAVLLFRDDECVNCNEIALELFDYDSKDNILGKELKSFIESSFHSILTPSKKPIEVIAQASNLETFSALIKIQNTQFKNREFTILTVMDISELKEKDKLLAERSKMAAMGEMIGNIAHQWRQPLSTISTAASGIKLQKEFNQLTDDIFHEGIEGILRNTEHLSQTIDDFKNFLKNDKEKTLFTLLENINTALSLLEGMLKSEHINVIVKCDENIKIYNNPHELTQVFLNLLTNAKDAFSQRDDKNSEDKFVFINVQETKRTLTIEITDTAGGIHKSFINKIFEPYFTTKHKNVGTGLGLYMTHQLVEIGMNGSISAKNRITNHEGTRYKGAGFTIKLPT